MGESGEQEHIKHTMIEYGQTTAYVGEFVHQLDARNRVTVPSSWRVTGDDGNYYFAWPHPEGCIAVYPPHMQQELLEKASHIKQSDVRGQTMLRKLFGRAYKFGCDKQGRILLPDTLKDHSGIEKKVSLVGLGHYFQIWDSSKREIEDEDFNLLEAMAEMGI
ncbi:mraZ [Puniceicoccales bacterium CK1056]|uniref:Transcriptional regulator MraZ n=1 Tax=Oceanipulchritudo coccoides TaxID=2706888 RepID=A0A6B2M3H1_9BACT|nr:mraZ [Oceanipulchritudo coccoides]NDV63303.1 mraZ [Oceanipulchritudo coccoides]